MTWRNPVLPVLLLTSIAAAGEAAELGELLRWSSIGPPPGGPADVLAVSRAAPGVLFVSTVAGAKRTTDNGATWANLNLGAGVGSVTAAAIDPAEPSTVYAVATRIFRSLDGGETWSALTGLPPFVTVNSVTVSPLGASRHVVFAATDQGIYSSRDRGGTWTLTGAAGARIVRIDFSSDGRLGSAIGIFSLFRSSDSGATWREEGSFVVRFLFDPFDSGTAYEIEMLPRGGPRAYRISSSGVTEISAPGDLRSFAIPASGFLYASTESGVFVSADRGDTWSPASNGLEGTGVGEIFSAGEKLYVETSNGIFEADAGPPCSGDLTALCLGTGRFRVAVAWTASNIGQSGSGRTVPLTADTGAFWFFQPSNLELVVKVLDGRTINGKFWVFWGALTNVGWTLTVTDTATGDVRTYTNPEGQQASGADTEAF